MKAALHDRGVSARLADPEKHLRSECRGGEQAAAVQVLVLGHGQRRGDGDAAGVGEASDVEVIDLEPVPERGVDEGGALGMSL